MRYSRSHRRDRHSHSSCCSTDQRHGVEALYLYRYRGGERWALPPSLFMLLISIVSLSIKVLPQGTGDYSPLTEISPLKASRDPKFVFELEDA